MKKTILTTALLAMNLLGAHAEADPNFYIYLCFGQSNMEGNANIEAVDRQYVDDRFQTLACTNFSNPARTMGQWYTAYPPIVRAETRLGMADYFGRSMVAALPAGYRVGVVDVAIGGVDIKGFMQEEVAAYVKGAESWMKNYFAAYDNDPYQRLVDMGRIAQQAGVIKGILLHQGETNNGQQDWPQKVKTVYERLLADLGLTATEVPLFVGEVVGADAGGACSLHNSVIARVPSVIPTAHVVSSAGCPAQADKLHFTAAGYRTMGKRYAIEALRAMGRPAQVDAGYTLHESLSKLYTATGLAATGDLVLKVGRDRAVSVKATFADGHSEDVTAEAVISADGDAVSISGNVITARQEGTATVGVSYTDFTGATVSTTFRVEVVATGGTNRYLAINNGSAGSNAWDREAFCYLKTPMTKGKTYVVSMDIKADRGGDCALWPIWTTSANRNQWGNSDDVQYLAAYRVGSSFQTYTWTFSASFPHDQLQWAFGLIGGKICFDNVSCKEQGSDEEMVENGDFESDNIAHWSVISWSGQTMGIEEDTLSAIAHTAATAQEPATIYNLNGQRVLRPARGLYIVGGRIVSRSR